MITFDCFGDKKFRYIVADIYEQTLKLRTLKLVEERTEQILLLPPFILLSGWFCFWAIPGGALGLFLTVQGWFEILCSAGECIRVNGYKARALSTVLSHRLSPPPLHLFICKETEAWMLLQHISLKLSWVSPHTVVLFVSVALSHLLYTTRVFIPGKQGVITAVERRGCLPAQAATLGSPEAPFDYFEKQKQSRMRCSNSLSLKSRKCFMLEFLKPLCPIIADKCVTTRIINLGDEV